MQQFTCVYVNMLTLVVAYSRSRDTTEWTPQPDLLCLVNQDHLVPTNIFTDGLFHQYLHILEHGYEALG